MPPTSYLPRNNEHVTAIHKCRSSMIFCETRRPHDRLVVPLPAAQLNRQQGMRHRGNRRIKLCAAAQAAGTGEGGAREWAEELTAGSRLACMIANTHTTSWLLDWNAMLSAAIKGGGSSSSHAHLQYGSRNAILARWPPGPGVAQTVPSQLNMHSVLPQPSLTPCPAAPRGPGWQGMA